MRFFIFFIFPVFLFPVLFWSNPASATPLAYFEQAASHWGVPLDWTLAIAQVESGHNPWALNIEGRSYFFTSKEAALQAARKARRQGKSFDSGIMQVNNQWLDRYGISLDAALDPEANILLGSWILAKAIEQHGQNWRAVGAYHSPTPARANQYAAQVRAALEKEPGKSQKAKSSARKTSPQPSAPKSPSTSPVPETKKYKKLNPKMIRKDDSPIVVMRRNGAAPVNTPQIADTSFVRRVHTKILP